MRFSLLATDYDGTLATDGRVTASTVQELRRLLDAGRRLIMVTGRELEELLAIFPEIDLFDAVVAENGALLYRPSTKEEKRLAEPPSAEFVAELRKRGVGPISVGRTIVATWQPHETTVLDVIREMGLELQVIFNKGAVMVLPAGMNKATGLKAALKEMKRSLHEVVGVGDAENDHAFLSACECSAAVSNALPAVKERVDIVLTKDHGDGVCELMEEMRKNDLADRDARLTRHDIRLGGDASGTEVRLRPYGPGVLIAGPSGSGKSTTTTSLIERLHEQGYQFCLIDPEGDYDGVEYGISLGSSKSGPTIEEVLQVLEQPDRNVIVNLVGMKLADRPAFFLRLMPALLDLRGRTGRPHWLIVDEAHHLLPASGEPGSLAFSKDLNRTVFVTVHPGEVHPTALQGVGTIIAVGAGVAETIGSYCEAISESPPNIENECGGDGEVMIWQRAAGVPPRCVKVERSKAERRRHTRKYAEGELAPDRSFYFRGPEGKLNLRAQNLMLFLQLADGVDEATWLFHLQQADYSRWFREMIKDNGLADEAAKVEQEPGLSSEESRQQIRAAVESRYTLPAKAPRGEV